MVCVCVCVCVRCGSLIVHALNVWYACVCEEGGGGTRTRDLANVCMRVCVGGRR